MPPRRMVMAIGHFGNFELYARIHQYAPGYHSATTYRALKQPALNKLMQSLREKSGCLFFERRTDGKLLRTAMNQPNLMVGFLADQSTAGLRGPFLGRPCSTTLAPAVFALRYDCELYTGFCFRMAPAKWRLELGDKIATHENGAARSSEEIMGDVNRSFERAVLPRPRQLVLGPSAVEGGGKQKRPRRRCRNQGGLTRRKAGIFLMRLRLWRRDFRIRMMPVISLQR